MPAIAFRQPYSFDSRQHQAQAVKRVDHTSFDLTTDKSFRVKSYVTAGDWQWHLGWGVKEPSHTDMACWQAILVINPNGWVLKGSRDASTNVFQDAGDLVLLDQSVVHHVVWERAQPEPTRPWLYLFLDLYKREKWLKSKVTKQQAIDMARAAVVELEQPATRQWLSGATVKK